MLRTLITTVAAFLALGLGGIATAEAAPKHCANHGVGTGQIYIHACATGSGGGGEYSSYKPSRPSPEAEQRVRNAINKIHGH